MSSEVKTKINQGIQNHNKKTTTVSYSSITSDRLLDMGDSRWVLGLFFFFLLL